MVIDYTLTDRFGANLLRERTRADLSQEGLGLVAGLHRTEIGHLERGQRVARIDTLIKLAAAFEISPCDLLAGISWRLPTRSPGSFEALPANEETGS